MHKHDANDTPICRPFRSLAFALPLFHHRSNAASLAATARFHSTRLLFLLDLYRSSHDSTSHQTQNKKADLNRLTSSRSRYSLLLCSLYFREKSFLTIAILISSILVHLNLYYFECVYTFFWFCEYLIITFI